MTELKPCPFCGSKGIIWERIGMSGKFVTIGCSANDSDFHGNDGTINDWCPMNCETSIVKELAVEAWNTRANDVDDLTKEIDIIINGEEGSARQASLCDLVGQIKEMAKKPLTQWQPIETAPKDGTHVLLSHNVFQYWALDIGCFHQGSFYADKGKVVINPTHWMPLPEQPAVG